MRTYFIKITKKSSPRIQPATTTGSPSPVSLSRTAAKILLLGWVWGGGNGLGLQALGFRGGYRDYIGGSTRATIGIHLSAPNQAGWRFLVFGGRGSDQALSPVICMHMSIHIYIYTSIYTYIYIYAYVCTYL